MQSLSLEQSIVHTLAFFDVFDACLTAEEVEAYLWRHRGASLVGVQTALVSLVSNGTLVCDRGYFGLRALADERIQRIVLLEMKLTIALRAAQKLRYIPFVRAAFVCNNLALGTVRAESDVDVFIIVSPGRMWIARLIVTAVLRLFGLARTKRKEINRVCLSFYATTDALDMSKVTITDPDIYLMYWVRSLMPIYDPENLYHTVQQENTWIDTFITAQESCLLSQDKQAMTTTLSRRVKQLFERMWTGTVGDLIEKQAKEIQKTKMKFRFDSVRDEPDSRVVITDDMLKFHENDRRVQYREEWEERLRITDNSDLRMS